jgi:histidinol-phosphatase (PHP family)
MSQVFSAIEKVSVHGGHSGQFCHHASDSLEEVIRAYVAEGFSWVGITEHMAPLSDALRYPDEVEDDLGADYLLDRFRTYLVNAAVLSKSMRAKSKSILLLKRKPMKGHLPTCTSWWKI